jgi:hypothetical protein
MRVTSETEMLALTGKLLAPPKILYAEDEVANHDVQKGCRNLQNLKFATNGTVESTTRHTPSCNSILVVPPIAMLTCMLRRLRWELR